MKRKQLYLNIILVLIFVFIVFIFLLSSQTGDESHDLSEFTKKLIIMFGDDLFLGNIIKLFKDYNIRKIAHLTIFFILGSLIYVYLFFKDMGTIKRIFYSLLFCFLCACLDEVHQYFVPGRTFYVRDIFIDMVGSGLGVLFFGFVFFVGSLFMKNFN